MADRPVFTYQTRLTPDAQADRLLAAYAEHYGRIERTLFAALRAGQSATALKSPFQKRFGITSRQFNAVLTGLEGKVASITGRRPELIAEGQARVAKAQRVIAKLEKDRPGSNKLHQKKRRLETMKARLATMQADQEAGHVRLCFGSKKLFRAQFALAQNGYADHASWLADWKRSRSRQFFVLGSQDETAGNQTCQAHVEEDGSVSLQLRLPDALAAHGKYLKLTQVRFAYGHDQIVAALKSSRIISALTQQGKSIRKRTGTAISYRFLCDEKGWRVFASLEVAGPTVTTHRQAGAIGVDLNADHLAIAETDRFGNLIQTWRIDLPLFGKSPDQARALVGDAVNTIARRAQDTAKPVVCEKLNFQRKKAELEDASPGFARMLSSFAYSKLISGLKAACFRHGVEVIEVNPAYTSVIGAVNHAQQRGISVHQGAAYAIARRGLGLSEKPVVRTVIAPVRNGGHVTFALPVRNRAKHVWTQWAAIRTRLKAAHVAHDRSGLKKEKPAPLSPEMRALGAYRSSSVELRGVNRFQHCSGSVLEDVPY